MAVTADTVSSDNIFGFAAPTTAASRIAVRGAPSASVNATVSMHITKIESGIPGKAKLRASAIIVDENKIGKIGPPR